MASFRTTETQGNHDLFDAFGQEGCPVCVLVEVAVGRYMGSTNYDSVSDPDIRRHFERSHGFCNTHAHQWLREAFVLGTAHIYRDVLLVTSEQLRGQSFRSAGGVMGAIRGRKPAASSALEPSEGCPACAIREETESRLLKTLLKGLGDDTFVTAYAASDGLCLPHLRLALDAAPNDRVFRALRARALQTQETMIAQLNETIRKHDYRFRHEPAGEEKGSPQRAVDHVAGGLDAIGQS
ncbi:MAG TPA: DUF6062 family protein [Thermomicrobiales bacterium]|nr:DUF6062 family protein [Thermomicrobiales bacterium]